MTQASSTGRQVSAGNPAWTTRVMRTLVFQAYTVQRVLTSTGHRLAPVCLLLLALGFNIYHLGIPSVWFDEAFSVELASQPLPLLWHIIFDLEPNMLLYHLFLHAWLSLTGLLGLHPTEFVVRFPSAIFAALSTLLVFFLGQQFLGSLVGLVAASLYMLNDLQLIYAQQARSYSLQLLLICLAWYALLQVLTAPSRRRLWWLCFIVATALAIYAHLFSLVILLAQMCAYAGLFCLPQPWRARAREQISAFLISLSAIFLCIIPLMLHLDLSKTNWLPVPHLLDVIHLLLAISGTSRIYLLVLAACCGLSLSVAVLPLYRRGGGGEGKGEARSPGETTSRSGRPSSFHRGTRGLGLRGRRHPQGSPPHIPTSPTPTGTQPLPMPFCKNPGLEIPGPHPGTSPFLPLGFALLCWLVVPLVASYTLSQGSLRLFAPRYLVTILPALFLLVGMGVASLRWRRAQLALALLLWFLALSVVPYYYRSAQVEDWNVTALWIEQHYQTGDGLVCYDNALEQGCQISIEYYFQAYPSAAHFSADTPGAFSWRSFGSANPDAAVDTHVLATYAANHPRLFFIVGRLPNPATANRAQLARTWLDTHYHCIGQVVTRTVIIRLYTTGEGADNIS